MTIFIHTRNRPTKTQHNNQCVGYSHLTRLERVKGFVLVWVCRGV